MNYTGLVDIFDADEIEHNTSPRFELCMYNDLFTVDKGSERIAPLPNSNFCFKYFDTEQEAEINAGVSWPYEKLGPYELLIAEDFKEDGLSVGDTLTVTLHLTSPFNVIAQQYNKLAPEMGWN